MRTLRLRLLPFAIVVACSQPTLTATSPHDPAAREAVLLTAHDVALGRKCHIVDAGGPLPDIATLLDTAAIPELLKQAAISPASGYALFSVRFDSGGHPSRARLIDATIADTLREGVQQTVASALLDQPAGPQHPVRLRVDFGAHPTFRVGKSEYCDAEEILRRSAANYSTFDQPGDRTISRGVTSVAYDVELSRAGEVLGVRFGSVLDPQVEDGMRQAMLKSHWKPAIDDGLPVASHASGSTQLKTRTVLRAVRP